MIKIWTLNMINREIVIFCPVFVRPRTGIPINAYQCRSFFLITITQTCNKALKWSFLKILISFWVSDTNCTVYQFTGIFILFICDKSPLLSIQEKYMCFLLKMIHKILWYPIFPEFNIKLNIWKCFVKKITSKSVIFRSIFVLKSSRLLRTKNILKLNRNYVFVKWINL
jgi:hypothetical protein